MKNLRSKKRLISDIENIIKSDIYTRFIALDMKPSIIVIKEYLGSECDYIDLTYDASTNLLSGRPVHLKEKFKKKLLSEDGDTGVYLLVEDLSEVIKKEKVFINQLHPYISGLKAYGLENQNIDELPDFIKCLHKNSLKSCVSKRRLLVPTHLLFQLTNSGLEVSKSCDVELKRTGKFIDKNLLPHMINACNDYIDYQSMFRPGEYIRVYGDHLCIVREEDKSKELLYMENFNYRLFYSSSSKMIISLLLAYYHIIITTDASAALIDIYNEKFNTHDV